MGLSKGQKLAVGFLATLAIAAWITPWLPLPSAYEIPLENSLQEPQWSHSPVLGTDAKGRDLFARTLAGARISLLVGLLGSAVALFIGLPFGALAGFFGGKVDRFLMRTADFLESIPLTMVVLFFLSFLGEYKSELASIGIGRLQVFYLAIGLLFWLPTARVARAEALQLRKSLFVDSAFSVGASKRRIILSHIFPNLLPSAMVMLTLTLPRVILMEAFLSFLGLGVEPPGVSWGILASEGMAALNPLVDSWWLLGVPAFALGATLLALNHLGDGLRDRLVR